MYNVDAALNHVEYSGDDMSSKSEDDDDFTRTVSPEPDATDSSDSSAEESEGPSNAGMFIVYNIYYQILGIAIDVRYCKISIQLICLLMVLDIVTRSDVTRKSLTSTRVELSPQAAVFKASVGLTNAVKNRASNSA